MKLNNNNRLLYAGIIFLAILSYRFGIAKTLGIRAELQFLKSSSQEMQDIPHRTRLLAQKNKVLDSVLGEMDLGDNSLQNNLLRTINLEAKKRDVKVMGLDRPHISKMGANDLFTYSFRLSGGYGDILKVVHIIEQKGNFGKVAHIDLEKKKDYRTNTYSLGATVFVQHLK